MNGEAAPGGVDGRIVFCGPGTRLTIEPTNPGDVETHAWVWAAGDEQPGVTLKPAELRSLAADLLARADLIDPDGAGRTEWACRWACDSLTPAQDEEWARKHAKNWHTTPMRRTCGPWEEA